MKITLSHIIFISSLLISSFSFSQSDDIEIIKVIANKRIEYNKTHGSGFKIQLYNGDEKRARSIKANFQKHYYWINTKLHYEAPDWKVQVGNYQTRLDADRGLNKIREKFPNAIIIEK